MNRRNFFSAGIGPKATAPFSGKPSPKILPQEIAAPDRPINLNSGIAAYGGPWGQNELIHLLKRTMFGAKKADVDAFKSKTLSQVVDLLLTVPATAPSVPVKNYTLNVANTPATDPDWNLAMGQSWVNVYTTDGSVNSFRRAAYKAWWTGLMLQQEQNILEKMVLFWHNHFATETVDVSYAIHCYLHNTTLRKFALGNFKAFVKAITLDPAMLRYLNGEQNNKTSPDENYGRELQELFTLGKGPDSQYTEADVKQAARVLTGYRVNYANGTSYFDTTRHDTGNKTFSGFFDNKTIIGKTGAAGTSELDEMLDMIFAKEEVSKHIVRKLYRYFVYYDIDAATEAAVIVPLALLFRQNNYEIKPVLAALLKSEHFFDALNHGCFIKSPLDMLIGSCREYDVIFPAEADYLNAYYMWSYIAAIGTNIQQNIGDPPDVSGWKAYYQAPQFHEIWINSDTLPKRNQFTDLMINNGYTRNGKTIRFDPVAFTLTMPNPGDPNELINDALKYLYRIALSQTTKDQIKKDILLTGQTSDYYWTTAWTTYIGNPNTINTTTVRTRLRNLYQYLMNLSEYQLA